MQNTFTSLFHAANYEDSWKDYLRSIKDPEYENFDYFVLTASNKAQADGYVEQLRIRKNYLPKGTKFLVIPDPQDKRVGSGGATLNVLATIAKKENRTDFNNLKILVIHSGGDSKRVPQYSALGKLFSPVPRSLPDGCSSTLFDEFLISMSSLAPRIKSGMVLLSGDVLLLFNPLQVDYSGKDAAAISFKEDVETGKNHGVYLKGEDGFVKECLQKQSVSTLKEKGAVNENNQVDIDTGAIIFSCDILNSLYSLICTNNQLDKEKYNLFINETSRISLYADLIYPLASNSTLEQFYKEKPEGQFSDQLTYCREKIWEVMHPYRMKLLRLAPSKFIHFGTSKELLQLMTEEVENYSYLGWKKQINSALPSNVSGYDSILENGSISNEKVYLESSIIHNHSTIGRNSIISCTDVNHKEIPDDVILHTLKIKNGKFVVRILGIDDNPKSDFGLFGICFEDFKNRYQIKDEDLFGADKSLWNAKLYPACDTIDESLDQALNLYHLFKDNGDINKWLQSNRYSLNSSFIEADNSCLIAWSDRMKQLIKMEIIYNDILNKKPISEINEHFTLTNLQKEWLLDKLEKADFSTKMRLFYYFGRICNEDSYIQECFKIIQKSVLEGAVIKENNTCCIVKDKHSVYLPLRVNFGGGWSDTPPYCLENGGSVLNAAITLNGSLPVEVTLTKIKDHKIIFESNDMSVYGEFDDIKQLQSVGDPFDPFVLQKSALIACGIIPQTDTDMETIFNRLGGGFKMDTEVHNVPKGSGLGTSSILAGACVKALFEFMGIDYDEDSLYATVSCMEQIMSTGGGWQDQVGGLSNGLKFITTRSGLKQDIKVEHVELDEKTFKELQDRFALIYTGQRRLARNLLRDVVGRYIGNEKDSLYSLNEIQRVASLMRFELKRGHVDDFAKLMDEHWKLSKMVDEGSTNTLIDQIFTAIDEYIDGRLVCGAGGGGFLQVIMKKGVTTDDLHRRLKEVFADSDVDVYDAKLI